MNKNNHDATPLAFLQGDGAIRAMMRTHDWSTSPLGHPTTWPATLRVVLGLMLDSKFPMFVAWGPELGFLYNDSYTEILGTKHPASLGLRFQDIWSEIWDDLSPLIDCALEGEATYSDRLALTMRRYGYDEQTWFTYSYSPVRDETGQVVGMYCTCVEVTEQVLAEKYRKEENERFRTLFEQAPGIMAILRGRDHVFELTNQAYYQLVGHREILGKPARDALPEVVGQGFIELLDKVYVTGEPFLGHAIPVKLQREPNGPLEERFVDFVYQPIRDARGIVSGIFAEGSDITERKLAEEELRQIANDLAEANQRQNDFLATLAHELRNPLAPIRSGLDLMRLSGDNVAVIARIRQMMERQVDHLVHLVNDLLDVARISTGKIHLKKEHVLLKDVVLHAVETASPAMQAKRHDFSMEMVDEPIWLDADVNRLVQIIGNILSNAGKYTPDKGKIALSARREGSEAVITVTDNGIGIPEKFLPHIFDLFTQVEHETEHNRDGLGIGLSLVKRLTEKHGGTVSAHSAGPGQGTRFILRLPVAPPEAVDLSDRQASAHLAPGVQRALRILVVDDNQDAAGILQHMLEIGGHTVRAAYDGQAGLKIAKEFLPDLAILDIGMPSMNGYELARALRKLPQLHAAHLIALTGWGTQSDRERALAAGFEHHLTKPINVQTLECIVTEIMSSTK